MIKLTKKEKDIVGGEYEYRLTDAFFKNTCNHTNIRYVDLEEIFTDKKLYMNQATITQYINTYCYYMTANTNDEDLEQMFEIFIDVLASSRRYISEESLTILIKVSEDLNMGSIQRTKLLFGGSSILSVSCSTLVKLINYFDTDILGNILLYGASYIDAFDEVGIFHIDRLNFRRGDTITETIFWKYRDKINMSELIKSNTDTSKWSEPAQVILRLADLGE